MIIKILIRKENTRGQIKVWLRPKYKAIIKRFLSYNWILYGYLIKGKEYDLYY